MNAETITSRQNPLMTHLRKLASSRSYRKKSGEYVCDGTKLLDEALKWGAPVRTAVFSDGITIPALPEDVRVGIMEADIDSDVDAETIAATGTKVIQLHTGGMCHLDADMTRQGIRQLGTEELDLVVLENVGNLVCPAEFDTGAAMNMMILSVPEGHDKPLKYPLVFQVCDAMIVNKIDVLPYFDFDMDKVTEFARRRNPNIQIFPISAKTGEGVEALARWLGQHIQDWKQK